MGFLLLAARIVLAAVFALAGAAKLRNLNVSRKAVGDFGLANWLAAPIGSALPFAELGVAVLLLPVVSAWWGGLAALTLLVAFIAAITVNLAQGRKPDCQCFGQIQSRPIGWPTLVRNGLLALCAVLIVSVGAAQTSIIDAIARLSGARMLAALVAAAAVSVLGAQTWLIFQLFKQHGRLLLRMDELEKRLVAGAVAPPPRQQAPPPQGLPLGAPAPAFELPTLAGELVALDDLHDGGKSAVLIFSDPSCGPCTALLPEIGRWQRDYAEKVRIALISRGTDKANRAKVREPGVRDVLLQRDREVAELYQANGTPAAVLVRADGSIGSRVVGGSEAITSLVATAVGEPVATASAGGNGRGKVVPMLTSHAGIPMGDVAPSATLPDLSGKTVSLSDFKGRKTLVLFWNPGCGFCQRMLPDLKTWEESRSKGAPALVVISTGTVEANQQMGLQSPVLLDAEFAVARQFRGGGTPSGVLVDADGKIASELAVGAPNVLALAGVLPRKPEEEKPAHRTDTRAGAAQVH